MSGNIKVVVRCRPLNAREIARGADCLIRIEGNQTILTKKTTSTPLSRKHQQQEEDVKAFTFDRSYWSGNKLDDHYADQELVYNDLGRELLDHAFDGYNCCIFAYGQTGSGKSYSMMGYGEDKGIIPRTCSELFERVANLSNDSLKFQVEVSYIEIYNEKVRDLLNPGNKGNLKVREHPTIGPYVEDLSRLVVNSFEDIDHLMSEGNKARTVAATNMNETSSRSHAIFTLFLTSNRFDQIANLNTEKASRISLVDLAGSERANSTGATGARLKEGANINKSLTTLGKVIAGLAEQSESGRSQKRKTKEGGVFIPYRDSVLTYLLKDSLGGNSKTAMIAAISPADYDETLSTLRYADQAKRIKNKAIVNEDPNARLVRELKEELQALRDTLMIYAPEEVEKIQMLQKSGKQSRPSSRARASPIPSQNIPKETPLPSPTVTKRGNSLYTKEQVIDQFKSSEKLLLEVNQTWEQKMSRTEAIHREREKALEELGVIVEKNNMGVYAPRSIHLINLNEDPLMTECLMYQIKLGITRVGRFDSSAQADIKLSGDEIRDDHCYFENNTDESGVGAVTIYPGEQEDSITLVNGTRILEPKVLHSGYRIILGSGLHHVFRFNNPDEVRREREQQQQQQQQQQQTSPTIPSGRNSVLGNQSVTSESSNAQLSEVIDWKFAHREALLCNYGGSISTDLDVMTDEDLKQLSEGISKVREFRNRKRISSENGYPHLDDDVSSFTVSPRTSISSSKRLSVLSSAPTLDDEELDSPQPLLKDEREKWIKMATEEMQQQLEIQKQEYQAKLKQAESSKATDDELDKEKEVLAAKYEQIKQEMELVLEQQKAAYESKIKRISAHLPPGTALSTDNLLVGYTSKNAAEYLLRQSVTKWKELKFVKMAEDCLVHAVILKEANIMAKELGKNVTYQFTVVHDDMSANPLSFWESTSALQPFSREPDVPLLKETKPCLGVQVIDLVHRATYIWSIAKIKNRLRRMRRLYDYTDGPLFGQHFHREDPFYETPCPRFSLLGLARIPLKNLTLQLHADNRVDVYCRNTGEIMGQIRVSITPIARSVAKRPNLFIRKGRAPANHLLQVGQQQVFEVRLHDLTGIDESQFTQVHAQFRLSSFGNVERHSSADKTYQTDPISNFGNSAIVFDQNQTLSVTITEKTMDVILHHGLEIEVYGQAQENYLYDLLEYNGSKMNSSSALCESPVAEKSFLFEQQHQADSPSPSVAALCRRLSNERRLSLQRRTFDGVMMEEKHDVLAWIQICELDADGDYVPVPVVSQDVFCLRQGLQRRIALTLLHDSGKRFDWKDIKQVKMGHVRLVDSKGRQTESPPHAPVEIHLFPTGETEFERNGISKVTAQGPWDSSLHDSLFLNRITATGQRIRLTLSWQVACDRCVAPLYFDMDISVQIQARESGNGVLRQFLGGGKEKQVVKASGMFVIHLKPPMMRQVRELWRLNTANKYVRGEEFIGSWRPRGVSLITDYRVARRQMLRREAVAASRHALVLAGHPQTKEIRNQSMDENKKVTEEDVVVIKKDPKVLLKKVIDLWTKQFGTREEIIFSQDPPSTTSLVSDDNNTSNVPNKNKQSNIKLIADIQQLLPSDTITKKGFMLHPKNVDDTWQKHWFVLRRPFIIIYEDQSETDEIGVLNLTSVKVDYTEDLEDMLQIYLIITRNVTWLRRIYLYL
ncbi:kinesin-domain-containing protein [Backusella circina FSU 941]|nr:kinesin-domain-containing protein [Backusella circina FSU 941]